MKTRTKPKRHLFLTKNFITMLVLLVVIIATISAWFTVNKTVTADSIMVKAVSTEIDIAECIKTYNTRDGNGNLVDGEKAEGVVLSDGPGEFGDSLTFEFPNDFGSFTKDCTGDGMDLIVPEFNITKDSESVRIHGGKEVNTNASAADARSNMFSEQYVREHPDQEAPEYQYVQLEFYVRSKNKDLYLRPESCLVASTEYGTDGTNGRPLSTTLNPGDDKLSAYGSFNVDGLVGAMRVSLIGEACTTVNQTWQEVNNEVKLTATDVTSKRSPEKQILWIPRPDVYLNVNENTGNISNWSLITGVQPNTTINRQNQTINVGTINYNTNTYYSKKTGGVELVEEQITQNSKTKVSSQSKAISNNVSIPCLGSSVNITNFTYSNQLQPVSLVVDKNNTNVRDNYYVTKYTMKIWIEGTDAEARRAMDGGAFSISLYFG